VKKKLFFWLLLTCCDADLRLCVLTVLELCDKAVGGLCS
jgi:hypothetical protein